MKNITLKILCEFESESTALPTADPTQVPIETTAEGDSCSDWLLTLSISVYQLLQSGDVEEQLAKLMLDALFQAIATSNGGQWEDAWCAAVDELEMVYLRRRRLQTTQDVDVDVSFAVGAQLYSDFFDTDAFNESSFAADFELALEQELQLTHIAEGAGGLNIGEFTAATDDTERHAADDDNEAVYVLLCVLLAVLVVLIVLTLARKAWRSRDEHAHAHFGGVLGHRGRGRAH